MRRLSPLLITLVVAGPLALAGCTTSAPTPAPPSAPPPAAVTTPPRPPAPTAADTSPATAPAPTPTFDLSTYSTTDPTSPWVIVNKQHPLNPIDYAPKDLVIVHGYYIRKIAATDLTALLDAAKADGVTITLRSTYRSHAKQVTVYNGLAAQDGQAGADRVSARPGYSEHQTGLAIDVGSSTNDACDFNVCFADTAEGRWVTAHATEYGFIVRYTVANQAVTGYSPEPWHLRYVGRPLAAAMKAAGITTLEEVFGVSGGPNYG